MTDNFLSIYIQFIYLISDIILGNEGKSAEHLRHYSGHMH
jgi:hypothetical protein